MSQIEQLLLEAVSDHYAGDAIRPGVVTSKLGNGEFYASVCRYSRMKGEPAKTVVASVKRLDYPLLHGVLARVWVEKECIGAPVGPSLDKLLRGLSARGIDRPSEDEAAPPVEGEAPPLRGVLVPRRGVGVRHRADGPPADRGVIAAGGEARWRLMVSLTPGDRERGEAVLSRVERLRHLPREVILGGSHEPPVVAAKRLLYRSLRRLGWSWPKVGAFVGRGHATVLRAAKRGQRRVPVGESSAFPLREAVAALRALLPAGRREDEGEFPKS